MKKKRWKNLGYRKDVSLNTYEDKLVPFTGSMVCYAGPSSAWDRVNAQTAFVEISDCRTKVCLHSNGVTKDDLFCFCDKLERMSVELTNFRRHLLNAIEEVTE